MARSSRLVRNEQRKLVRQTFFLGGLAVVLLAVFLFGLLPLFIRLTSPGAQPLLSNQDTIPPQVPVISAPLKATNSAEVVVDGFGEAGSEAVLIVNGQESGRTVVDEAEGTFQFQAPLNNGENSISVYAVDEAGNESASSRSYSVTVDNEAPTLTIEYPTDGETITLLKNQTITVKGLTEPGASIKINGRIIKASSEGSFSLAYQLAEGMNQLNIQAIDEAGNQVEQLISVTYSSQ